jgi:dTDP-4-amino-4,6-dideoxygalactose transaminase
MPSIPFHSLGPQHLQVEAQLKSVFLQTLTENSFILGKRLEEFEVKFARFSGCRFCAGVANGLDAVALSLKALGIGEGDEVLVPSNTFIATWLAVSATGATPVAVEPDPQTYNIDPTALESSISQRTKAIIPVHLFGLACDMTAIINLATRYNLFVVEDNAQAHGAMHRGQTTGSFGHINATSFYPIKNLGALGDGGATTTNDPALDTSIRMLRNYGAARQGLHKIIGINSRLDEIQAAFLAVKLDFLHEWNLRRLEIADRYIGELRGIGDIITPSHKGDSTHVYHRFVIRTLRRDSLRKFLADNGVETMVHYPVPPHLQGAYAHLGYSRGAFPIAEQLADTSLSLPLWPGMTEGQIDQVISVTRNFWT